MSNAQNIGDWGFQQETVANTRIPYASTLLQENDEEETDYEKDTDWSILYEKEDPSHFPETMVSEKEKVPLSVQFVQTKDDDPSKIESMMMYDPNIPLDLRFVHIQNSEGDDVIRITE